MKYAEVDFWLGSYGATVAAFDAMAATPLEQGPGFDHSETVQVVSCFAVWRDFCAHGGSAEIAFYKNGAFYYASDSVTMAEYKQIMSDQLADGAVESKDSKGKTTTTTALSVWGAGPHGQSGDWSPGEGLPEDWGSLLAAACDWSIDAIDKAKQAASKPPANGARVENVLLPAAAVTAAIIVAGVAASVIGTVAAWRFFDPKERTSMAAVAGASNAYMQRIDAFKATGKMPPPSQVEIGARKAVEAAAGDADKQAWMMFGMATGGIVAGTVLASFINYKMRGAPA